MLVLFGLQVQAFSQEVKIPQLLRRVTDFTNTLSTSEINALENDLARFEDTTSTQIVVVMIQSLGGESIEDFSLRTAEVNGIGQKKTDNGALLLIAKDDRKIRIEVGYGLEGALPDGLAGHIIRREITPHFKSNDYYSGIKAGIDAIMQATRNEYKSDQKESDSKSIPGLFFLLLLFLVVFMIARSRKRSAGILGAGSLPIFLGTGQGRRSSRSTSGWGGGGGFGGFSGGGGSFGGGGASGSW